MFLDCLENNKSKNKFIIIHPEDAAKFTILLKILISTVGAS